MQPIIRQATKEDMPAVLALIRELAKFEKETDAVALTVADLERDGFGESPLFTCFVAELDGGVCGMALCYNRYSTWKGKTVHLEDLIVSESKRGKGLGGALYKRVMQFAKTQGVRRVEWVVLDWNTPAIDYYKRTGATMLAGWNTVQMDEVGLNEYLEGNK